MKKIFYEKIGRRYYPVSEYDSDLTSAFPKGTHLVVSKPGGTSTHYRIDPALAPMIAAGRYAEDSISEVIRKAGEIRPVTRALTLEQRAAYDVFINMLPEAERYYMTYGSARDAAEAGIKAMEEEAKQLLTHPAVQKAYDHFMLVCKLTKDAEET